MRLPSLWLLAVVCHASGDNHTDDGEVGGRSLRQICRCHVSKGHLLNSRSHPRCPNCPGRRKLVSEAPEPSIDGLSFARNCFAQTRLDEHMDIGALRALKPDEFSAHRQLIWEKTKSWHCTHSHTYAGYSGPWLENHWLGLADALNDGVLGGVVPIFACWTDGAASGRKIGDLLQVLAGVMRTDVAYVTVCQHDRGLLHFAPSKSVALKLTNLLVLSAGGNGHVAVPLLKQEEKLLKQDEKPKRVMTCVATINKLRPARGVMRKEIEAALRTPAEKANVLYYHGDQWKQKLAESAMALTPRGSGRTTFSMYEAIQMGDVPLYLWDDYEWLPYRGSRAADWDQLGLSVRIGTFAQRKDELWSLAADPVRLGALRARVRALRASHFTYAGVLGQITRLLANGTADDGGSDLRCAPNAPLGGPFCKQRDCFPAWMAEHAHTARD